LLPLKFAKNAGAPPVTGSEKTVPWLYVPPPTVVPYSVFPDRINVAVGLLPLVPLKLASVLNV
jgi:hypothetical protein